MDNRYLLVGALILLLSWILFCISLKEFNIGALLYSTLLAVGCAGIPIIIVIAIVFSIIEKLIHKSISDNILRNLTPIITSSAHLCFSIQCYFENRKRDK